MKIKLQEAYSFFQQNSLPLRFNTSKEVELFAWQLPLAKQNKALIMLPGRAECSDKYYELAFDLKNLGFDIYIFDWRGQGHSTHLLPDSTIGHCQNFEDYIFDLELFFQKTIQPKYQHISFISHSMGAAILFEWLKKFPHSQVEKVVLNAPMFAINTGPFPMKIVDLIIASARALKATHKAAPTFEKYPPNQVFENNTVTHCQERFEFNNQILEKNQNTIIGPPSIQWVIEALELGKRIENKLNTIDEKNILIVQASEDKVVQQIIQQKIALQLKKAKLYHVRGAYHESLMEIDRLRTPLLNEIKSFLTAN